MNMKNLLALIAVPGILLSACSSGEASPWAEMDKVMERISAPTFPDKTYIISDYYNGTDSLYTEAINGAIAACSSNGGGVVVIPAGVYRTAPIRLLSNVNLHLDDSAKVNFITDPALFESVLTRIEGIDCYNLSPLIYAYDAENVAVTGNGVFDGGADTTNWFNPKRLKWIDENGDEVNEKTRLYKMKEDSLPVEQRLLEHEAGIRPQFINLYKCKNVLLEGFTLNNSPFWLIHPLMCENVTVRGVTMQSHWRNNDGCDPESCRDVLIDNCFFNTGDDCIAVKSGRDQDGRRWNLPCENVIVRNCNMRDGHAGVAMGSEITGSVKNVWVEDCTMDSPNLDRIIRIKSNAVRGGEVENVFVRNITVGECRQAILGFELHYWNVYDGPYPPYFHNIQLENITSGKSRYVLNLDGFDDKIQARDIIVKNCSFNGVTDPEINHVVGVDNIVFENVTVNGEPFQYSEK